MRPAACTPRRGGLAGRRLDAGRRALKIGWKPARRPRGTFESATRRHVAAATAAAGSGSTGGAAGRRRRRTTERNTAVGHLKIRAKISGPAGPRVGEAPQLLTILRGESAAAGVLARRHGTDVTRPRHTHASHSKSPDAVACAYHPSETIQQTWRTASPSTATRGVKRAAAAASGRRPRKRHPRAFIPVGATARTQCDAILPSGRRSRPRLDPRSDSRRTSGERGVRAACRFLRDSATAHVPGPLPSTSLPHEPR